MQITKDFSWSKFGDIGARWKLIDFEEGVIKPSWATYRAEQFDYWHAYNPSGQRFQLYFGNKAKQPMEAFEDYVEKGFKDYKAYVGKWLGLCEEGATVSVIPRTQSVIVLSPNWTGKVTDHCDLEVWLKREYTFGIFPRKLCCEIYSFGYIEGKRLVSHQKSENNVRDIAIERLNSISGNRLRIGSAIFEIVE